ncbi:hypothetical protein RIF29_38432 [Crotalaria pallida]|uniref:Uncharacterized protein n=1 Tax=Crotalaria pallida TaxID=3830 RepID=A0AAN9E156_CROPI
MALSPLAVKSLEESERGDALLKRAELKKAMKADSVVTRMKETAKKQLSWSFRIPSPFLSLVNKRKN